MLDMAKRSSSAQQSVRQDFYADPLVYDVLHRDGTKSDIRAILQAVRRASPSLANRLRAGEKLRWFEPACGSGRYLRSLALKGHTAIGFDISPSMVGFANRTARKEKLGSKHRAFVADMRTFEKNARIAKIDIAFNLINSIRHVPTDAAMVQHLKAIKSTLAPGGVYVVGLSLSAYGLEDMTEDVWNGRGEGLRITQVVQYLPPMATGGDPKASVKSRAEHVISHMSITQGRSADAPMRHIDSTYTLLAYNMRQWLKVVDRAGMTIAGTAGSSGEPIEASEPGYFLFVLCPI